MLGRLRAAGRRSKDALPLSLLIVFGTSAQAPPPAPTAYAAIARHVSHVDTQLAAAGQASDDAGRRALAEARISVGAARRALDANDPAAADQLAASADDLLRAALPPDSAAPTPPSPRPPAPPGPPPPAPPGNPRRGPVSAARVLANVDLIAAALATVSLPRVRDLLDLSRRVAGTARRAAALDSATAAPAAERAEAIARAAAHVAIAGDPALGGVLPRPPRPPRPPLPPPSDRHA